MEKNILISASHYKQKYYFNPKYKDLPSDVEKKLRAVCVLLAEKTGGIVTIGFYKTGDVFFDIRGEQDDFQYDEIGAGLELKEVEDENKELFKTLKLWYIMYHTKHGEAIRKSLKAKDD